MLRRASAMLLSAIYSLSLQGGLSGAPPDEGAKAAFLFPEALEIIEENAFVSTAASRLVFGGSLRSIGEGAFSETRLLEIFIPAAQVSIADSAFPADRNTTIHGGADSTARQWAERHGLAFVPDGGLQSAGGGKGPGPQPMAPGRRAVIHDAKRPLRGIRSERGSEISMRPQDRPELNPIDYRFP